jgi:hypothetical protein
VFYGFRWVSWYHPLVLGLCTLGAVRGAGPRVVRAALFAIWMVGIGHGTWIQVDRPRRPDYRAAAAHILQNAQDRDAVASLPTWFQRGILGHYFFQMTTAARAPSEGEAVWILGGKTLTIEAVHPSLPFESTALSPHYDRLWVAVIQETMFGRDKFSAEVAAQAVAWADANMQRIDEANVDGIRLLLYRVPRARHLLSKGEARWFRADRVVLNSRTYPRAAAKAVFTTPAPVPPREILDETMVHQAPMSPGCIDWEYTSLDPALEPEAPTHWLLELRIPVPLGAPEPEVRRHSPAQIYTRMKGQDLRITAVGGPCTGPAPVVEVIGR